ncbi:P-loop containing nucleoside triphosphate hydrolase protein [Dioscorea alata]|uniref:P-loop containing nucleoside triphosphate hydrolase protein n=1 Tax=Dioscorea alata TaxID=55571 RepID=A0ACB7UU15_DIOAL|nr:P-loop containing nucleoside triphosphate hydrolase protein [Dioscorea alata]
MAEGGDDDAVLSDIEGDDPSPIVLATGDADQSSAAADHRVRELLAELEEERRARKAAEDARSDLQTSFDRLKAVAHDIIKKRDEVSKAADRAAGELSEMVKVKDEAVKQKDSLRSEMEAAAQMLVSGIDKISGKVSNFKNFSAGGLPRSNKYTGLPAVAYGVIKRTNEIVEELVKQIDASTKSRDQARELMEQRNFEIAIEVSQLEATIGALREEVAQKGKEIENLEKLVADGNAKVSQMEKEMAELRQFGEECDSKLRAFETKVDSQRPLLIDQLNYISKAYEEIHGIINIMNGDASDQSESSDSLFMWKEVDMDENLQTSSEGTKSVCELAKVALEKVREGMLKRNEEVTALNERLSELLAEKQHIGTLLRSALSSKTNEILQVAEDGLREAGIDLKLNGHHKDGLEDGEEDEVYTLAGALENTVKTSQLKIIELQHLVEALRAESGLLKAHLDTQAKEINQLKRQIKQLEEQERVANESVEGLMMDIATAEEEIARWKAAAEQEAAAGRAVEQEFQTQLSTLRRELDEAKQTLLESENKLKFKEETAAAAMAARDAAEKSLRLADMRATRLRERVEELTQQLEESENQHDSRNSSRHRYVCWPWQWLGLDLVRNPQETVQSSNEMELSEPLI